MNIILVFEWIAFALSLLLFHQKNDPKVRLLIVILLVTVTVEAIGYYYHRILGKANHQFYNVSVPLIISLFLILLSGQYQKKVHKTCIHIGMFCFVLFAVANAFFIQGMTRFCTYTYIVGALLLVVATAFYFLEMIHLTEHVSLKREPSFWICTAVLILYLPKCILYAVFEYLAYHNEVMESFGATFHLINKVLSVIFFSCLSYASICRLIYRN